MGEIDALPGNSFLEKYAERNSVLSQKFLLEHPFLPYGQTANLGVRRIIFTKIGFCLLYTSDAADDP